MEVYGDSFMSMMMVCIESFNFYSALINKKELNAAILAIISTMEVQKKENCYGIINSLMDPQNIASFYNFMTSDKMKIKENCSFAICKVAEAHPQLIFNHPAGEVFLLKLIEYLALTPRVIII